jgi:hypothetical protein
MLAEILGERFTSRIMVFQSHQEVGRNPSTDQELHTPLAAHNLLAVRTPLAARNPVVLDTDNLAGRAVAPGQS